MAQGKAQADPLEMWREWVANSERQWNAFLNNAMSTDEFSQTMGRFMDVYVNIQKNMNDVMGRYFTAINVPTRNDILHLGERLTGIEERLTAIESGLKQLSHAKPAAAATPAAPEPQVTRPPRTKRPAKG